jgi:hypothetical protein
MKILLVSLLIAFGCIGASCQTRDIPQKEFTLTADRNEITLKRDESAGLDIVILKSKEVKGSMVSMGVSSTLPAGIAVNFDPEKGLIEMSTVKISASGETKAGIYNLIITAKIRNKLKGIIVKLIIS